MDKNSKTIISACYITNIICSATSCVSPLLFLTLKTMYNISYSLLGLLIVIGFLTQLFIDLIFTFFSKKFNINLCVILMPILSVVGLIMYGLTPWILPHHEYIGLVISTFFISISSVLIILGDFCPQGNFLLLRYIHRAYQFIDNLYFLYSLSVYPLRSSNVNLIYKTIQNFGRQFLYFRITSHQ